MKLMAQLVGFRSFVPNGPNHENEHLSNKQNNTEGFCKLMVHEESDGGIEKNTLNIDINRVDTEPKGAPRREAFFGGRSVNAKESFKVLPTKDIIGARL